MTEVIFAISVTTRAFHSWAARSTWSLRYNFAAVNFEISPLVVIAFFVPSRECEGQSEVFRSVVTYPLFFSICHKLRRYVWRRCYEGQHGKQADILVSSVFPILLETSLVSSFSSTFYQKHDFAPDCLCLRVVCDRSKMIGLPQSNFKLKSLIVFNRMRLSSGNVYIGPYSPVKWLRSGFIGRWQEESVRTTLVSHSPGFAHRGMLSIKPFHSKEDYIPGFSLHQSRLYESGIFSVSARPFRGFTALRFCNTLDTDCWRFPPT